MRSPYAVGELLVIHLDPWYLPDYALRTVTRLLMALFFSLMLTFVFGTLAAKNRKAETFILAAVDVLQSIPVLSFLAMLAPLLIGLFPGSLLGPEFAAIIAVITSNFTEHTQAQAFKTVKDEKEFYLVTYTKEDVIVVLFHDHGSRYVGKMFNDEWMREQGFLDEEK